MFSFVSFYDLCYLYRWKQIFVKISKLCKDLENKMVRKLKFGSLLSKKQFRWSFDDSTNHDGIHLSVKHRLNCSTTSCLIMHKNEEFQTQRTWESLKRNVIDLGQFFKNSGKIPSIYIIGDAKLCLYFSFYKFWLDIFEVLSNGRAYFVISFLVDNIWMDSFWQKCNQKFH